MPAAVAYLWTAFQRIRQRRGGNGFGPCPVEWTDIEAFSRLSGIRFAPWEVEIIEELDDLWLLEAGRNHHDASSDGTRRPG